uniref:DAZ-associated protein 2 n=2 Tax=Clytia hemisphaerica TaxID=252671 RepID=A0A7M5VA20_9CNID
MGGQLEFTFLRLDIKILSATFWMSSISRVSHHHQQKITEVIFKSKARKNKKTTHLEQAIKITIMSGKKSPYPTQQNSPYPTQPQQGAYPTHAPPPAGYPPQGGYPAQPPVGGAYPPQPQGAAPPPYSGPPPAYAPPTYIQPNGPYQAYPGAQPYPVHGAQPGAYPPRGPVPAAAAAGSYDAAARFGAGASYNIPPPPPGCAPNAAQAAQQQGHNVVMNQQKSDFWNGTGHGGYTFY